MPGGLFSWRPRFGRKTPEPSQAVQITLPPEPKEAEPTATSNRNVRFDDARNEYAYSETSQQAANYPQEPSPPDWSKQSTYGEARVIGTSGREKRAADWHYGDDIRVNVAPLASTDIDADVSMPPEPPRCNFSPPTPSRANTVLQSLREQKNVIEHDDRRRHASTLPANDETRHFDDMHVVFLQANDEVKRIILPPRLHSLHQVKLAFVRTFPNLTRAFVEQPHVKIYIQEPTKGALFYELEDPSDIKHKSVLRLRERTQHARLMSPVEVDYHSETEQHDAHRRYATFQRPASALAAPHNFSAYADPYASDVSGEMTRSGSTTPVIIDTESRARMESMERQLAGLSSLVHTALVSKGMSASSQRDMAELRKEILSLHPIDGSSVRESSEEPTSSLPESISSHTASQLSQIRQSLRACRQEAQSLKEAARSNAQSARVAIQDAVAQLVALIGRQRDVLHVHAATNDDEQHVDREVCAHAGQLSSLIAELTEFEKNVEGVRSSVLSNQKKLRMSEVEEMTEKLTNIGRMAANLKTNFPSIQSNLQRRIKKDMERVLSDEKFIRDQSTSVDQSLRRCKSLANIMVTMKKLAMVQDPTIQRQRKSERPPKPMAQAAPVIAASPQLQRAAVVAPLPIPPPPPPPPPQNAVSPKSPILELDGVLEEMGESMSAQPPRPPSRYSVTDVRQKFSKPPELPEQFRVENKESSEISEKRQLELEERQEMLAEKQRQLRNQFESLQQLTPKI